MSRPSMAQMRRNRGELAKHSGAEEWQKAARALAVQLDDATLKLILTAAEAGYPSSGSGAGEGGGGQPISQPERAVVSVGESKRVARKAHELIDSISRCVLLATVLAVHPSSETARDAAANVFAQVAGTVRLNWSHGRKVALCQVCGDPLNARGFCEARDEDGRPCGADAVKAECKVCGEPIEKGGRRRNDRCNRCDVHMRRHGREWPDTGRIAGVARLTNTEGMMTT